MIRAYKFLLYPTMRQTWALGEMLRDHCSLYNGALEERRSAYRHASRTTVRYGQQSGQLKDIRALDPERQGRWSFSSQQATLRRLDKAFAAFFRRIKSGEAPGYPRFRGVRRFDTVDFPKDGDGCRWDSTPHDPQTRVRFQGVGHVKVKQHRPVAGKVKTVSVKREGRRWYVILTADQAPPEPLPATGAVVGIDLGIASFLTTSDGRHVDNPRHSRNAAKKLEAAQQALARSKRGSKRRRKAVERVATLHRKVRRQRLDHAHTTALGLVRDNDLIAHEDLKIRNMSKAPEPRPNGDGTYAPNGAAAKAGLNRSIADAGWGVFLAILAAKAEGAGREVIAVDPRNTSRTCPECGHVAKENRPTQEKFHCQACGHTAHADVVGASNVLRAGLARRQAQPA
ncbi:MULTISPECIES: RNA-guided endonuclease TnpB family protein [Streptomyces]|uniref:RNA-guided endonuclease InsQ/TnpB family protein n=1 Tax=Streptomyces TaxID=1883 RepID=UPI0011638B97|nr:MULTISPECIES: RNA-guided endonuclease TnpB family protein [Streptomyces]MCX5346502.1 transposase [Streptomyces mirabilis]QDO14154.1 transposase [Streptomyces sp. S1D4-23]